MQLAVVVVVVKSEAGWRTARLCQGLDVLKACMHAMQLVVVVRQMPLAVVIVIVRLEAG